MDYIKNIGCCLGLVGLEVPDHVPGQFVPEAAKLLDLGYGLLNPVLAEVPDAGSECGFDGRYIDSLGYGNKSYLVRRAPRSVTRSGDALIYVLYILLNGHLSGLVVGWVK